MEITREKFIEMTGEKPLHDDLERCNCKEAGKIGHYSCGICEKCNKPRFMCGHLKTINK